MASTRKRTPASQRPSRADAISLLKADHRQVEAMFLQFDKSRKPSAKQKLASDICEALTIHSAIEEEIFYPAFLQATEEKEIHHKAVVEHDGAKKLIDEIREMSPDDDYFNGKVAVLEELIKLHVKEEEKPGGMLAEAKKSNMDLARLGQMLLARKQELQAQSEAA